MNGSILYAVTDIVALVMNRRMAPSTVVHHFCTAAALFVVLTSDLRQDGVFKGGVRNRVLFTFGLYPLYFLGRSYGAAIYKLCISAFSFLELIVDGNAT